MECSRRRVWARVGVERLERCRRRHKTRLANVHASTTALVIIIPRLPRWYFSRLLTCLLSLKSRGHNHVSQRQCLNETPFWIRRVPVHRRVSDPRYNGPISRQYPIEPRNVILKRSDTFSRYRSAVEIRKVINLYHEDATSRPLGLAAKSN